RGFAAESQTLVLRLEQAGPGVAEALGITEGDAVIRWRRLRHADGAPMSIEEVFLNEVLLPGFLKGVAPTSLYDELGSRSLRPTWVQDTMTADLASPEEASLLGLRAGAPVVRKQRRGLREDKVIEVSRSTLRADRYALRITLGGSD
ncbi:GntR family transcriptional regulator, partial [Nocardioides sp. CER28]